jgi:quercetin dioxygenase-like cupin family protein
MTERPLIDGTSTKNINLLEETQYAANGIVSRTVLRTPYSRVVLFGFSAGQELSEHTSTQHATVQILTGECDFQADGQLHRMKAGDCLYMPPNTPHAVLATQDFSMLLTLTKP